MLTPLKAIRAKCLDCCCGSSNEVRLCPCPDCYLYPYRFGHNPNRAGIGNPSGKPPTQPHNAAHNPAGEGSYTPGPIEEENSGSSQAKED